MPDRHPSIQKPGIGLSKVEANSRTPYVRTLPKHLPCPRRLRRNRPTAPTARFRQRPCWPVRAGSKCRLWHLHEPSAGDVENIEQSPISSAVGKTPQDCTAQTPRVRPRMTPPQTAPRASSFIRHLPGECPSLLLLAVAAPVPDALTRRCRIIGRLRGARPHGIPDLVADGCKRPPTIANSHARPPRSATGPFTPGRIHLARPGRFH